MSWQSFTGDGSGMRWKNDGCAMTDLQVGILGLKGGDLLSLFA